MRWRRAARRLSPWRCGVRTFPAVTTRLRTSWITSILNRYLVLPNTSGAMTAEEAVRLARLAASAGLPKWVKLEIHPDPHYLLPDPIETLKAAEQLVREGFVVMPYINADPVLAKRLQEVGAATVMPLGSPIGSNRGIQTRDQIRIIIDQATVPVVVDAGIGAPSHAAEAMELGADAVLVNTAIAIATDPGRMAAAFRKAVEAGRAALRDRSSMIRAQKRFLRAHLPPILRILCEYSGGPKSDRLVSPAVIVLEPADR